MASWYAARAFSALPGAVDVRSSWSPRASDAITGDRAPLSVAL
jgi:hypothetical protein